MRFECRFDFPELKAVALEQYKYWQPETTIIEAKASGQPLLQEFRRMGIPVMDFTPGRGKRQTLTEVNAVALFLSLDKSIILETKNSDKVIEELHKFSSWRT